MQPQTNDRPANTGLITSANAHELDIHRVGPLLPYTGLRDLHMPSASELRHSLEAFAHEEVRQRTLVASLREPVITTAPDGRISGFNAAAVALFGEPGTLYGRPIEAFLPFVEPPRTGSSGSDAWQGQVITSDGRRADLEVTLTRLGRGGGQDAAVYVVHDVTHHAELSRLREQLLYSVAHELGGPLAILTTTLDLLKQEGASLTEEESGALLHTAQGTALRLKHLMDDLLTAGSIRAGRFKVELRPTPIQTVVSESIEAVLPQTARREQRILTDVPRKRLLVRADGRYLCQVLVNLLTNASKFSPDQTSIELSVSTEEHGLVRVAVTDHGPGISRDLQDRLFERFYRLQQHTGHAGTGLGLSIAHGIVEAHGGRLELLSEIGKGTRVSFTLRSA